MIENKLNIAFPIYDSLDKQNHRKSHCFNDVCTFKLVTGYNKLLPFQFIRSTRANLITDIELWCYDDVFQLDITAAVDIDIWNVGSTDYIVYDGEDLIGNPLQGYCGDFYLKISDGVDTWYSEVFHIINDIADDQIQMAFGNNPGDLLFVDDINPLIL